MVLNVKSDNTYMSYFLYTATDSLFGGEFIHPQHTRHEGPAYDPRHPS